MRLDFNAFRLIKPANAVDHYEAGNPLSPDRSSERTCKARELNIIKLLKTNGTMTNKQLAIELFITNFEFFTNFKHFST